ncbi:hypothetical protein ACQEVC_45495 [Plantactinospora sp. CA-294935]|uniref:phage tail tube protein n=1 Tax=Plantactinospora sp. CA-294935 TaxID=3240012 RepID=UPI003D928CCC
MTSPLPTSVPSDGTLALLYVASLTDPTAPKLTEINAVTSQELDGYITGDGWQPTGEQAVVADERIATTQTFEQPGRKTKSLTVVYVHNPADPTNNEAYITLAEGTTGYVLSRYGVPRTQAWAIGDLTDVWPITAGEPMKNWNGANSVHTATQRLFVTNQVQSDVAVVA